MLQPQFHFLPKMLPTKQMKADKLLNMLTRQYPMPFLAFVSALKDIGMYCLAGELLEEEKTARVEQERAVQMEEEQAEPTPTEGRRYTDDHRCPPDNSSPILHTFYRL